LEPLDRRELKRIVERHEGDHGVGSGANAWTCIRHLKAMLFAQVAGLNSLREIEQGLLAQPGRLYHLDLRAARRSTLSDAQAKRPAAVFREICESLMGHASRSVRKEATALVQLIDATPIPLRDPRFSWAEASPRTRGLKLHVGYDPRGGLVDWADISSAKVNDITAAREMPIEAGVTYVADKAYLDFAWWHRIHEAKALFVTRLKTNTKRRDVAPQPIEGAGILEDNRFKVGHRSPRGKAKNPLADTVLREIVVAREGKAPLRLVTNDMGRSACDIADLYKERWQIELLFKWLKQNLKIRRFLGRSENAVKIQIYCALIAFLLIRILRQTAASALRHQPKALVTRLRVALQGQLDLSGRVKPPPRQPASLPPHPQLKLALYPK
jgi:hypothetical protein